LHVTPRTIRYWISGKVLVPYAAYKLVRIMRLFELPCSGWHGWHMHSGRLWSPEGYGFKPEDSDWWSLLVRRATGYDRLCAAERQRHMDIVMQRRDALGDAQAAAGLPAQTGLPAVASAASKTGRKLVTPSFFPIYRNFDAKSIAVFYGFLGGKK